MTSTKLLKMAEKVVIENAPAILTGVGVVGTAATAYLTCKATFKAAKVIEEETFKTKLYTPTTPGRLPEDDPLSKTAKAKLVWKLYIIPAATGVGTIAAIVYANRISTKRAAALAAAYALSQDKFSDYKEKVAEKLGVKKEQAIKDELAQDQIDKCPPSDKMLLVGDGDVLCMDQFTGRYFHSTVEKIKRAENEVNFEINHGGWASLTDFYQRIGLGPTSISEEFGWKKPKQVEIGWSSTITADGKPCVTFDINAMPMSMQEVCLGDN